MLNTLPGGKDYSDKMDLLTISSLIKYTRPDWLASVMTNFYGELRGASYLRRSQNIEQIYTYTTNKRCTVLLFQQVDFTPITLINKMANKAGYKMLLFNAVRSRVEEVKAAFEKAAREQSWLVIDNIELLPSTSASLLIKEICSLFERTSLLSSFRVWITYKLELKKLDLSSNVSPTAADVPLWMGLCYYVFLDECYSVSEEMRHLHTAEMAEYNTQMSEVLNKKLFNRDKDMIDTIRKETKQGSNSITATPKKDAGSHRNDEKGNPDGINPNADNDKIAGLAGLEIQAFEVLVEKKVTLKEQKVECNFQDELQTYHSTKSQYDDYLKNKKRISYLLKLILSILRQRRHKLQLSQTRQTASQFNIGKDRQVHNVLQSLLDLCNSPGRGDPYQLIFAGLVSVFTDWSNLDDAASSPLILHSFFKTFISDLPKKDVIFDFAGIKYLVPGIKRFEDFGAMFTDSVLSFPSEDSGRLLGLRPNEERLAEYQASKICMRFLNSHISIADLVDDHSNYLEDFDLTQFAEDNDKNDQEILSRFYLNSIEYGFNLIQNHEFKSEVPADLKKIVLNLIELFSESSHKEILKKLGCEEGVTVESEEDEDSEEAEIGSKRPSLVSKSGRKTPQRMSLLETSRDKGVTGSHTFPVIGVTLPEPDSKNIILPDSLETTPESRSRADDFYLKTGLTPRKTKIYLNFNMNEKQMRDRYRKPILLQEYRFLATLLNQLCFDLKLAKFYLEGDILNQHKAQAKALIEAISANQLPQSWLSLVGGLHLQTATFKDFVKSLLVGFDSLYVLAVEMTRELPPIINLARLLSPASLLANLLAFNACHFDVSLASSVFMLMQGKSDSDKIYPKSMTWTISGLKIRGGRLDSDGKLIDEDQRSKAFDLGPLHLEITQFESVEEKAIHVQRISRPGEISLMLNTNFEDETDKTEEFLQDVQDLKLSSSLTPVSASTKMLMSGDSSPASALIKKQPSPEPSSRKGSIHLQAPQQGGLQSISAIQAMTGPRGRRPHQAAVIEKPKVHVVRLPVILTSARSFNALTELPVFFYCYSMKPQSHWLERTTAVVLDASN